LQRHVDEPVLVVSAFAWHAVHKPPATEYWFTGHGLHTPPPAVDEVPAAQLKHDVAPAFEVWPAGQFRQDAWPAAVVYLPAGHAWHKPPVQYLPALQLVHAVQEEAPPVE